MQFSQRLDRRPDLNEIDGGPERFPSLVFHILGITLGVSGLGMIASGVVEIFDGGDQVGILLGCGGVFGIIGGLLWRLTEVPQRIELLAVFSSTRLVTSGPSTSG